MNKLYQLLIKWMLGTSIVLTAAGYGIYQTAKYMTMPQELHVTSHNFLQFLANLIGIPDKGALSQDTLNPAQGYASSGGLSSNALRPSEALGMKVPDQTASNMKATLMAGLTTAQNSPGSNMGYNAGGNSSGNYGNNPGNDSGMNAGNVQEANAGNNAGGNSSGNYGNNPGSDSGMNAGNAQEANAGNNAGGNSGNSFNSINPPNDNLASNAGNNPGDYSSNGPNNNSGNGSGDNSGNGSGNNLGNYSGNHPGNGLGSSSGNGSGNGSSSSSGNGSGSSSGNGSNNSGPFIECVLGCYPGCIPGCDPECTPPGCQSTNVGQANLSTINPIPTDQQVSQNIANQNQQNNALAQLLAARQALITPVMQQAQASKYQTINPDSIPAASTNQTPSDIVEKVKSNQLSLH